MIEYKSKREIENIREAGKILHECHQYLHENIKEGMTGEELNDIIEEKIYKNGAIPSFKGYNGYPKSINVCVNNTVVHGIPNNIPFKNGDIVTIDIGACYNNFHADRGWTYSIGEISKKRKYLIESTEEALNLAISMVYPGQSLKNISGKIFDFIENKKKLNIVKELTGHGIGRNLHEDPLVLNYVDDILDDLILKPGLVICIEPIVTLNKTDINILDDDWTIVTENGCDAAQFEHTICVTKNGYDILT